MCKIREVPTYLEFDVKLAERLTRGYSHLLRKSSNLFFLSIIGSWIWIMDPTEIEGSSEGQYNIGSLLLH